MRRFIIPNLWTLLLILLALIWAFGSRLVYNPTTVEVVANTVRVYRTYPLHDMLGIEPPLVHYTETVRPLDTGQPVCRDEATLLHRGQTGFGEWDIEEWAARCMTRDFIWQATWTPYLFGMPLRSISLSTPVYVGG